MENNENDQKKLIKTSHLFMYLHLLKSNKSFIYIFYSRVAVMKPCCFMKFTEKKTMEVNEWFKDLVYANFL